MSRTVLRHAPLVTRSLFISRLILGSNPRPLLVQVGAPNPIRLSFFSSDSDPSSSSESVKGPKASIPTDDEDVSNKGNSLRECVCFAAEKTELKRRIQKFLEDEDDDEAIPSLFEAILKRKLSGKHYESDNELMEEIMKKQPVHTLITDDEDEPESD